MTLTHCRRGARILSTGAPTACRDDIAFVVLDPAIPGMHDGIEIVAVGPHPPPTLPQAAPAPVWVRKAFDSPREGLAGPRS